MVVGPPRWWPGATSDAQKPYACSLSRNADQGACSGTKIDGRLPLAPTGPTPVITRQAAGSKNSALDGTDVPPPPITRCTVPFEVSTMDGSVATGTGVSVSLACWPRMGWDRS